MVMEEPHKLLCISMDKELTFEWLVMQVGEELSERAMRDGGPRGTHIH